MKSHLVKKLFQSYSERFVSQWLILLMDLTIVFVAFYVANMMRYDFVVTSMNILSIFVQSILAVILYLFTFLFTKSYRSIIRHSGINDTVRLFKATGMATIALLILVFFVKQNGGNDVLRWIPSLSIVLIHFLLSLILLVWSRFLIKLVYNDILKKDSRQQIRVLIYGAGSAGMQTRIALKGDSVYKHDVVAFLDDNDSLNNKIIEGVPVITPERGLSEDYIRHNNISILIISINNMPLPAKQSIIDKGLNLGLKVKVIPSINQWINGQLSSHQLREVQIEELLEREPIRLDNNFVMEELTGKIVMVTGAAGSIGSEIVRQLITYQPSRIILIDQAESDLYNLQMELRDHCAKTGNSLSMAFIVANVKDRFRMEQHFATYRPQYVFHAAAYKHVPLMEENPYEALMVNVFGTRIVADLSVKYKAKKFVMVSTDKAVNPTNVMGATKRLAEIYIQCLSNGQTQFVTTRFGNVLGSNGSVIPLFRKQIRDGGPVTITHKDITRFFMTIPEACNLVLEAGVMGQGGEILVFDMGKSVRIYDLAYKMIQLSGYTPGKDIMIREIGLRPGEKLKEELLATGEHTLATHHPKILRAKVRKYDKNEVLGFMDQLSALMLEGDHFKLVDKIKQIIPEYISNNSIYATLDQRNKSD